MNVWSVESHAEYFSYEGSCSFVGSLRPSMGFLEGLSPHVLFMHLIHGHVYPFLYSTPPRIEYCGTCILVLWSSVWPSRRMSCCRYSIMGLIQLGCVVNKERTCCTFMLHSLSTSTKTSLGRWPKHIDTSLLRAFSHLLLPLVCI